MYCTCVYAAHVHVYNYAHVHVLMRHEKEGRKKEASKVKQTNKAKQHSTTKAVTFPKKNELPRVGLEPATLTCTLFVYVSMEHC